MWILDRDGDMMNMHYVIAFLPYGDKQVKFIINGSNNRLYTLKNTTSFNFCKYLLDIIESGEIDNIKVLKITDEFESIIDGKFLTLTEYNENIK